MRAPRDLAEQYQAPVARKKPRKMEVEETRRKRLDARSRELRRRVMTPSEEVVLRLARSGAIAPLDNATAVRRPARRKKPARQWESRCGKCGASSRFTKAAGLCARCGAIMIRE